MTFSGPSLQRLVRRVDFLEQRSQQRAIRVVRAEHLLRLSQAVIVTRSLGHRAVNSFAMTGAGSCPKPWRHYRTGRAGAICDPLPERRRGRLTDRPVDAQLHCAVNKAIPPNMGRASRRLRRHAARRKIAPGARQSSGQLEKGFCQSLYIASEPSGIPAVRQRQNVQRSNSSGVFP